MSAAAKKASIEVTQVLGDHLAEARVYDDKVADPIVPGDKIYTPLWTPGEKRHFALAGFMDVNGDGKNDIQAVKDMIAINGGVVDCYIDDKGKLVGRRDHQHPLSGPRRGSQRKGPDRHDCCLHKDRNEAEQFGVQKIQLGDLLQRVGWKNQMPTPLRPRRQPQGLCAKPEKGGRGNRPATSATCSSRARRRHPAHSYYNSACRNPGKEFVMPTQPSR